MDMSGETQRPALAGVTLLVLGICLMLAVLPDGMSKCEQTHGFDTCHSILNR